MFFAIGLVGLAVYAILMVLAVAFDFLFAPLRTLAKIVQKLVGVLGVLLVVVALFTHFGDGVPVPWEVYAMIAGCIVVGIFTEWFIERPTRAERKAAQRQQEMLEYQQHQYEMSIRQQVIDDLAARRREDSPTVTYSIPISQSVARALQQEAEELPED